MSGEGYDLGSPVDWPDGIQPVDRYSSHHCMMWFIYLQASLLEKFPQLPSYISRLTRFQLLESRFLHGLLWGGMASSRCNLDWLLVPQQGTIFMLMMVFL